MDSHDPHGGIPGIPPLRFMAFQAGLHRPGSAMPAGDEPDDLAPDPLEEARSALLRKWRPVLARLGLTGEPARQAAGRALVMGTGFLDELVAGGHVGEEVLFRAIAAELGLPFVAAPDPDALLVDEPRRLASLRTRSGLRVAMMREAGGDVVHLVADPAIDLDAIKAHLARAPHLRRRLRIAAPAALRAAVIARSRRRLLFDAQHGLFLRSPEFSARTVVNAWQGATAALLVFAFLLFLWLAPVATILVFHALATAGFFACIALRFIAFSSARPLRLRRLPPADPAEQPVYSVLVALYREKEMVQQLLTALGKLQWPLAKLEIKLVCEADDAETLDALHLMPLPPHIEVVLVPPGTPRTKPKALAYALPLCRGEFVTLYDAEDRPHPLQLVEAWQRFCAEGEDTACLQAPLVVTNGRASLLSLMFAFEYAALFRGLLPWLARRRLVLPLGGTSNHFRRAALDEIGGWDAYNVTEDAELGVRLARYGYRTAVITRPTYEDAPETLAVWLPQRVRWFKGWMQTWLVHMREPGVLWRELGPASFAIMQIMSLGMVVSALVHPFFAVSVLYALVMLVWQGGLSPYEAAFALVGVTNISFGYAVFIALGLVTLTAGEKTRPLRLVALTPVHWFLLSVAAWLALWEIYRRPHHWSKTPHGKHARAGG